MKLSLHKNKQSLWPPLWLTCGIVILVMLCLIGFLPDKGRRSLSEEDFIRIVRRAGDYPEADAVCFARDYDGNGTTEAFVEIGTREDKMIYGDLWYVSGISHFEKIKEQVYMEVEQKYIEDGTLMCTASDYDVDYDREMGIFTGHSRKAYPYYYEKPYEDECGGFWEYDCRELTWEEMTAYENGREILKAIEIANPGSCYEYLLWDNGMLVINRAQISEDFITFAYTTCQVEENRLTLVSEGEGCYHSHLYYDMEEVEEEERGSFATRLAEKYGSTEQ